MCAIQPSEQLTISYTDLLQTLDEREQSLMQRYAFTCCCARCVDDSPMPGDWFLDAVAADGVLRQLVTKHAVPCLAVMHYASTMHHCCNLIPAC